MKCPENCPNKYCQALYDKEMRESKSFDFCKASEQFEQAKEDFVALTERAYPKPSEMRKLVSKHFTMEKG